MGPRFRTQSVLTGMPARQAMQRAFPATGPDRCLSEVIRQMIRTREDAVLVTDRQGRGQGIITKTDLMAAFYGGFPLETQAGDLMAGPVETCAETDGLDQILDRMNRMNIHQIYARAPGEDRITGKISHDAVAGLIYRLCRVCSQGRRSRGDSGLPKLKVAEVMTPQVQTCGPDQTLYEVMDLLAERRVRALPVVDTDHRALGVISKSDLIKGYCRGMTPEACAREIMTSPAVTGSSGDELTTALTQMLTGDIQHLFVTDPGTGRVTGVVSLSDAARFRSGTCRACSPSRNF